MRDAHHYCNWPVVRCLPLPLRWSFNPDTCEGLSKHRLITAVAFPIDVLEMCISACTSRHGEMRWLFGSRPSASKAVMLLPLLPLQASCARDILSAAFSTVLPRPKLDVALARDI